MINDYKLSRNFRLYEFLSSQEAERQPEIHKKQFNPPEEIVYNIQQLVTNTLQPARVILNCPISISSGWRCPELNKLVGGSVSSQHMTADAADCSLPSYFLQNKKQKARLDAMIQEITKEPVKENVNATFYLFATTVIYLDELDIDQTISEYGELGKPAWNHISSSQRINKRQILHKLLGQGFTAMTPVEALACDHK